MFVIQCSATKMILGNAGSVVFSKRGARKFSIKDRAKAALRKLPKELADAGWWEVVSIKDAVTERV